MSWTTHFYDFAGTCCRFGVWWAPPPHTLRLGERLFATARIQGRRHIYEEVCG